MYTEYKFLLICFRGERFTDRLSLRPGCRRSLLPASCDHAVLSVCRRKAAAPEEDPEKATGTKADISSTRRGTD